MASTPQQGISRANTDTLTVPESKTNHAPPSVVPSGASTRGHSPTPSKSGPVKPGVIRNLAGGSFYSTGEFEKYFAGPRELEKHSKLPYFLRMSGSVTPRLIIPIIFVSCWATAITSVSILVHPLIVDDLLLTVLGFVIGLAISFRTSSAYERYSDGRRYWSEISRASRDLARHIWIHVNERHSEPELGKADLLAKVTCLNLVIAFSIALKHKLRFEPYSNHEDLEHLVAHLQTYAGEAIDPNAAPTKKKTPWKVAGEYLDLSFAVSNPRKAIKRSSKNLGNLPLEILLYLSSYIEGVKQEGTLPDGTAFAMALGNVQSLNDAMTGCERVLNTPLPVAYSIAISQITWVYILVLPFQLLGPLNWVTIPGCIVGAYVILALAAIGREIENPFGSDTNDLPLDTFCHQLAQEIDVICSRPQFKMNDFVKHERNTPMFNQPYQMWASRTTNEIRETLRYKATSAKMANNPIESEKSYKTQSAESV